MHYFYGECTVFENVSKFDSSMRSMRSMRGGFISRSLARESSARVLCRRLIHACTHHARTLAYTHASTKHEYSKPPLGFET